MDKTIDVLLFLVNVELEKVFNKLNNYKDVLIPEYLLFNNNKIVILGNKLKIEIEPLIIEKSLDYFHDFSNYGVSFGKSSSDSLKISFNINLIEKFNDSFKKYKSLDQTNEITKNLYTMWYDKISDYIKYLTELKKSHKKLIKESIHFIENLIQSYGFGTTENQFFNIYQENNSYKYIEIINTDIPENKLTLFKQYISNSNSNYIGKSHNIPAFSYMIINNDSYNIIMNLIKFILDKF